VIKPAGTAGLRGIVLSNGINVEYGKRNAYKMAWAVVDEAIRNAVAVGADPSRIAILDNFCWGDPLRPETLGTLVEAVRGCHDAAVAYGTPFISGKDSLNNEYMGTDGLRHAIPPTLLISAMGLIEDVNTSVTMDFKKPGNDVYLVGDFNPSFGGSHLCLVADNMQAFSDESIPLWSRSSPEIFAAMHRAISEGLVCSTHDLSEGGLLVCAAEMCIGGRLGLELNMSGDDLLRTYFAETTGCFLVEVSSENIPVFERNFKGLPARQVGKVAAKRELHVMDNQRSVFKAPLDHLVEAWGAGR
jgi:phosphoribosylformylglycinamidine synthase